MKRTIVLKKKRWAVELEAVALQKVTMTIFAYPEVEFSLTELAEKSGVSKSTAYRVLQRLNSLGIVKVEDKGIVWRIKANIDSTEYIKHKIVHNINTIYQTNLVEFIEESLRHPKAIILFGSFRKGDDISTSDIDIAVESDEDLETQSVRIDKLEEFEKLIGRKIQILLFNRKNVDISVFNNIANGIVLAGFLEVKP